LHRGILLEVAIAGAEGSKCGRKSEGLGFAR
jgi:hypothetical protein